MATYNFSPIGNEWQFFGQAGANFPPNLPLNAGILNTFQAGTNIPIATFANNLGSVQNAVSMVLGPDGRFAGAIWLLGGQGYKFQLTDSLGFQIWVVDNIVGINDVTSQVLNSEWIASGFVPTFSNATTFTTPGNTTSTFQVGRRVKATVTAGTVYGTVFSSTFGVSTTVVLTMDGAQVLDNGLTVVNVGILAATNASVPMIIPYDAVAFRAHRSTNQTSGTTIIFDTVDNQAGGTNYSNSTGIFTAPFTGYYHFDTSLDITNSVGGSSTEGCKLNSNGVVVAQSNNFVANGVEDIYSCGSTVFLSATQTASITAFSNPSAQHPVNGNTWTSFSGHLIQRTA